MTAKEIGFVEIDTPGKVVCYVELSGLPLPSLKGLDQWYVSYRSEEKIPVHTHRLTSTFVHARELTLNELASRAEDFKLFVQAVALGVLTRIEKGQDAGLYTVRKKGKTQAIGDEKKLRMNGMPGDKVEIVKEQVNFDLESLRSVDQLAIWVALIEHYAAEIYPLAVMRQDGVDVERKSLPTLMCEKLVDEWAGRLERKVGKGEAERLMHQARAKLIECTEEIPGSTADVYPYEVKMDEIQPKRVLRRIVLDPSWSLSDTTPAQTSVATPVAAPQIVMPPPLAPMAYFVAVDGQPTGPHNEAALKGLVTGGKLTRETKVWKEGMAGWQLAADISELAPFFIVPPPLGGTPPPLC